MLNVLFLLLRSIVLICGGSRAVALESLALRQQVAVLKRAVKRPRLRTRDRLFWILFARAWRDWRTSLLVVRPDTVVRWHRQWLRRRWTWRSTRTRPGRPSTGAAIRTLVGTMAAANPLWGAPRIHGELCKLGLTVSERTVSRLLRRPRRPSSCRPRFARPSEGLRRAMTARSTSRLSRPPSDDSSCSPPMPQRASRRSEISAPDLFRDTA